LELEGWEPGGEIALGLKLIWRKSPVDLSYNLASFEGLSDEKFGRTWKRPAKKMVTQGKLPEKRPAAKKAKSPYAGLFVPVA